MNSKTEQVLKVDEAGRVCVRTLSATFVCYTTIWVRVFDIFARSQNCGWDR